MAVAELYNKNTLDHTAKFQVLEDGSEYSRRKRESKENRKATLLKRIPLERLMDLKVDYAFKQLFGNEKNKAITVVFLNAILQKTGRNQIKDISFVNRELGGEYSDDKQSRLDLLVVTEADEWINVEIQFTNQYDMIKRSIYYWSKAYTNPLGKGMAYKELRPVIAINILNFDLLEQTERFHTSYHLYDDEEQFKLTNVMEFHFIEMGKLIKDWKRDKLDPWNSVLARWLLLLGMVDHRNGKIYDDIYKELEEIALKDPSLFEAFQNWEGLSTEQEQRIAYEARLKRIMDEEAAKREAELRIQEAERKEKEAEQKAKESIARRLLKKGMEIEFVADSTGLARNTVMDIRDDMGK
ncbi:Rpn family recombination-promoting nuclease/putative transposase [Lentibacillus salicampi]|uniref:Rpn family recombination-promoting nuclease/putative transposase n=1 Tax=Lentibacillus salicampi TaxID=175306 RepID=A0A4Y9AE83_9BACI|nr:Rpn family recombination-promoting nuclease/putative transposase [Lentibacillus salicampi]TFJ94123.1 Rpn family recombination-promoting nuclease/putative transposase [Lentibacillus salicampi]